LAAEERRRVAQWQAEDDARALKKQHELARRARLAAAAEQEAARQAARSLLLEQEVKAQEELLKVRCFALRWMLTGQPQVLLDQQHSCSLLCNTGDGCWCAQHKLTAAELALVNDACSYMALRQLNKLWTMFSHAGMLVDCQVEHQRRLRQLVEDEAELTAEQVQLQAERQSSRPQQLDRLQSRSRSKRTTRSESWRQLRLINNPRQG